MEKMQKCVLSLQATAFLKHWWGKKVDLTGNKSTNSPHLLAGTDLGTGNAAVGVCRNRRDLQDARHRQKGICVMTALSKKINLHPIFWDKVRASDPHHESKWFLVLSKGWPRKQGRCKHRSVMGLGCPLCPGQGGWCGAGTCLCSSGDPLQSLFRDPAGANSNNKGFTQRSWYHAPGRMLKDGSEKD